MKFFEFAYISFLAGVAGGDGDDKCVWLVSCDDVMGCVRELCEQYAVFVVCQLGGIEVSQKMVERAV